MNFWKFLAQILEKNSPKKKNFGKPILPIIEKIFLYRLVFVSLKSNNIWRSWCVLKDEKYSFEIQPFKDFLIFFCLSVSYMSIFIYIEFFLTDMMFSTMFRLFMILIVLIVHEKRSLSISNSGLRHLGASPWRAKRRLPFSPPPIDFLEGIIFYF